MRVEKLLKRLKREFLKVNLLQASLDSLTFFLSANLILFLFDLQLTPSFPNFFSLTMLTLLFFLGDFMYRANTYSLEIYEQKNPDLRERLRTARDNLESRNIVSQALFDEVLDRSRSMSSDTIIPSKRIVQKIVAVGILSFLTVLSGVADFQLLHDSGNVLPGVDSVPGIGPEDDEDGFELRNASEIFGERQDIKVSDDLVSFNITGEGETEENELDSGTTEPEDVVLDTTGPQQSDDVQLAKEYSLAIKDLQ